MKQVLLVCGLLPLMLHAQDSTRHFQRDDAAAKRFEILVHGGVANASIKLKNASSSAWQLENGQTAPIVNVRFGALINPEMSERTCIGLFYSLFQVRYKVANYAAQVLGNMPQAGLFINRSFGAGKLRPFVGLNVSAVFFKTESVAWLGFDEPKKAIGVEGGLRYSIANAWTADVMVNYTTTRSVNYYAIMGGIGFKF